MTIGILALQGAFAEHGHVLDQLGAYHFEIRQKKDLERSFDALILPGGESTVMGKLLLELGLFSPLKEKIESGLPTLATCAGLILLAESIANDERTYFSTLPVTVRRNAYGRQLGSFCIEAEMHGVGKVPMTFIRAPYVEKVKESVRILAEVDNHIVAVQYKNQIGLAFHPEVTESQAVHRYFLELCNAAGKCT